MKRLLLIFFLMITGSSLAMNTDQTEQPSAKKQERTDRAITNLIKFLYDAGNEYIKTNLKNDLGVHVKKGINITSNLFNTVKKEGCNPFLIHLIEIKAWDAIIEVLSTIPGIDPNVEDQEGQTPLFYLMNSESPVQIYRLLIKCGADINHKDKKGTTPFKIAIKNKKTLALGNNQIWPLLVLNVFLENNFIIDINELELDEQKTLLQCIIRSENPATEALFDQLITLDSYNAHYINESSHSDDLQYLLSHMGQPLQMKYLKKFLQKEYDTYKEIADGSVLLSTIILRKFLFKKDNGHELNTLVDMLLAMGIDPKTLCDPRNPENDTPFLHFLITSACPDRIDIIQFVLENKDKLNIDINAQDSLNKTALHLAIDKEPLLNEYYPALIELLLNNNAHMDIQDIQGKTPFDLLTSAEGYALATAQYFCTTDSMIIEQKKTIQQHFEEVRQLFEQYAQKSAPTQTSNPTNASAIYQSPPIQAPLQPSTSTATTTTPILPQPEVPEIIHLDDIIENQSSLESLFPQEMAWFKADSGTTEGLYEKRKLRMIEKIQEDLGYDDEQQTIGKDKIKAILWKMIWNHIPIKPRPAFMPADWKPGNPIPVTHSVATPARPVPIIPAPQPSISTSTTAPIPLGGDTSNGGYKPQVPTPTKPPIDLNPAQPRSTPTNTHVPPPVNTHATFTPSSMIFTTGILAVTIAIGYYVYNKYYATQKKTDHQKTENKSLHQKRIA